WECFRSSDGPSASDDPRDAVDRSAPGFKERLYGRWLSANTGAKHAGERHILRSEPGTIPRFHVLRLGTADTLKLKTSGAGKVQVTRFQRNTKCIGADYFIDRRMTLPHIG